MCSTAATAAAAAATERPTDERPRAIGQAGGRDEGEELEGEREGAQAKLRVAEMGKIIDL